MRFHAPKNITFWIAFILVVVGILVLLVGHLSWGWLFVLGGYILLALGVMLKGL